MSRLEAVSGGKTELNFPSTAESVNVDVVDNKHPLPRKTPASIDSQLGHTAFVRKAVWEHLQDHPEPWRHIRMYVLWHLATVPHHPLLPHVTPEEEA